MRYCFQKAPSDFNDEEVGNYIGNRLTDDFVVIHY